MLIRGNNVALHCFQHTIAFTLHPTIHPLFVSIVLRTCKLLLSSSESRPTLTPCCVLAGWFSVITAATATTAYYFHPVALIGLTIKHLILWKCFFFNGNPSGNRVIVWFLLPLLRLTSLFTSGIFLWSFSFVQIAIILTLWSLWLLILF